MAANVCDVIYTMSTDLVQTGSRDTIIEITFFIDRFEKPTL